MWSEAVKEAIQPKNIYRKLTKLVKIVSFECEITHANFVEIGQTLVKALAKKLMHPSSPTQALLPPVLILTVGDCFY